MTDKELLQQALEALETVFMPHHPAVIALRERLAREEPTVEDNSQNWRGMDGATAWHLIHRHADGWADVREMMGAWLAANQQEPARQEPKACGSECGCVSTCARDTAPPAREWPEKLWLWRNHVDGRPEYWAFDSPYPRNLDNGDPQTLGQPCGYALFKPSRDGSAGRTEEQVLREMKSVADRQWQGLTEKERERFWRADQMTSAEWRELFDAIEAKLREKNA